ncbi:uncharacterized protein LOC124885524 [Capsicum annuum]|uniref:uncharacterized protein LOC124885524 n=1 Tax=Capsicum annuum TaxID=4072 RepID=UPI001FB16C52|nr:uncharacterized protein LOC124885524 [Capsicum annuum]
MPAAPPAGEAAVNNSRRLSLNQRRRHLFPPPPAATPPRTVAIKGPSIASRHPPPHLSSVNHGRFVTNPSQVLWSSCARMLPPSEISCLNLLFISLLLRFKSVLMCCINICVIINYGDCLGAGFYVLYVPCESLRQTNLGFVT